MTFPHRTPQSWPQPAGVVILEAEPGRARDEVVADWLDTRLEHPGAVSHLSCDPVVGGPWAGLADLAAGLVPWLRARAPELLARHGQELSLVVPDLGRDLGYARSLSDTTSDEERTRNDGADRAHRCLHGLIDMAGEWQELTGAGPWSIACADFDEANALVRRFFAELWRRRGAELDLHLLVIVAPGRGDAAAAEFRPEAIAARLRVTLPRDVTRESPESPRRFTAPRCSTPTRSAAAWTGCGPRIRSSV